MSFRNCTAPSPSCPVQATTYGYYPNLGLNAALLACFGIVCCIQVILTPITCVYSYSIVVAIATFGEALGYGGRIIMWNNPWSQTGMRLQIVCLVLAPSFLAAGVYLTLKHVTLYFGSSTSRLKPRLYPWVFIGCDIASILLQAIGGGIAGSAGRDNRALLEIGNNVIIAGIAFQVVTMIACGLLAADYAIRRYRSRDQRRDEEKKTLSPGRTKLFISAVTLAYTTILIRCIYRIPELAGGWGNPRMRVEGEFLALDGLMIIIAAAALTIFHPGCFFPPMRSDYDETLSQT